jgi:hypothetical protein
MSMSMTTSVPDDARKASAGRRMAPTRSAKLGHLPSRRRVAGVEGVARGQDRDQAAGAGEPQALDDEVVVHRMAAGVASWVVQDDAAEGDVADDQVEVVGGEARALEALAADAGRGVQELGDRCRGGVELDAGDLEPQPRRRQADEVPGATPWLEHAAAGEAQLTDRVPQERRHLARGVVGVDGGAGRCQPALLPEELAQLLALPRRRPLRGYPRHECGAAPGRGQR